MYLFYIFHKGCVELFLFYFSFLCKVTSKLASPVRANMPKLWLYFLSLFFIVLFPHCIFHCKITFDLQIRFSLEVCLCSCSFVKFELLFHSIKVFRIQGNKTVVEGRLLTLFSRVLKMLEG